MRPQVRCRYSDGARLVAALLVSIVLMPPASGADAVDTPAANHPASPPAHELQLARLIYRHGSHSNWGPGRAWWRIDWPEAEAHFTHGIARYTAIDVADDSVHVSLLDEAVFDYPWLLVQQVGHWDLSDRETAVLREYLKRGGFLLVDDFHGDYQWEIFARTFSRVFPDQPIVDIAPDDRLMNILYDLDQSTQIPGRRHLRPSADGAVGVYMPDGPPRWRGVYDAQNRLMVAINFNMDMGDAWEHADDPVYPVPMTSLAYRFGINYVVYAMTH